MRSEAPPRFSHCRTVLMMHRKGVRGDPAMKLSDVRAVFAALSAITVTGCAATQVQENTLEMVNSVAHVREVQVLRNLSAAISDHDMVPTEILLSVGQATVATGASPAVRFPKFSA